MTVEKLNQELADIPQEELIEMAEFYISELAKSGGNSICMSVPPKKTDTDMLLGEVCRRLKEITPNPSN